MAYNFQVQNLSTLPQAYISLRLRTLTAELTILYKKKKEDEEGYGVWIDDFASMAYLDLLEVKSAELLLLFNEVVSRLIVGKDLELLNAKDEVTKWALANDVPNIAELDGLDELMQKLKL